MKTRFIASVGFTPQLLLGRKTRDIYFKDGEETEETDWNTKNGMRYFNISLMVGIGAEHSLSERFFIRSEAIARFGVLSLEEYTPLTSYIYSLELNIGLYLNLFEIENRIGLIENRNATFAIKSDTTNNHECTRSFRNTKSTVTRDS